MKKALIIALCCISVLFAACKKEKANEKFIGNYKGECVIEGTFSYENPLSPGQYVVETIKEDSPMEVSISAGGDNKVVMRMKADDFDETYTVVGTVDGGMIAFEEFSIENIEGLNFTAAIVMAGALTGNLLTLTGPFAGEGAITIMDHSIPFSTEGDMTCVLNKQ